MHIDKSKTIKLLKTVRGQLDGLIKMVEDDRYCIDISNQLMASQSILRKINLDILSGHLTHCIKESIEKGQDTNEKLAEIVNLLNKLMK
ncbi:metal-sensing transcriptional repressor [bacterium]|nr:metal-sensing transcriptional repressor [bacterium]